MRQTVDGQPGTGLEYKRFFKIINKMATKESNENKTPKNVERDKGTVEKLTMASMEYFNNPQKDQLVSPTALSMFSYSIQ